MIECCLIVLIMRKSRIFPFLSLTKETVATSYNVMDGYISDDMVKDYVLSHTLSCYLGFCPKNGSQSMKKKIQEDYFALVV